MGDIIAERAGLMAGPRASLGGESVVERPDEANVGLVVVGDHRLLGLLLGCDSLAGTAEVAHQLLLLAAALPEAAGLVAAEVPPDLLPSLTVAGLVVQAPRDQVDAPEQRAMVFMVGREGVGQFVDQGLALVQVAETGLDPDLPGLGASPRVLHPAGTDDAPAAAGPDLDAVDLGMVRGALQPDGYPAHMPLELLDDVRREVRIRR